MARSKLHLQAGRCFVVKVMPQSPAHKIEVTAEPPLLTIVPRNRIDGGPVPTYHAEFSGHSLLGVVPLPRTGKVHITVIDGLPDPCRLTIPVTIWPAYSTWVLWWVLGFLSVVGLRWQRTVAGSQSFGDVFQAFWNDLPFLLMLLPLGFLLFIPVWFIGWIVSLTELGESGD